VRDTEAASMTTAASPPRRGPEARSLSVARSASVVLALFENGRPSACLRRAATLAGDTDAALHLVRVLPEPEDVGGALDAHNTIPILRSVEHALVAHRAMRSWIHGLSLPHGAPQCFSLLHGDFVTQVVRYVEEVDAQLLVFAGHEGASQLVSALTARTRTPVLVSRPRSRSKAKTIVAATDLQDAEYPVLQFATELGRRLDSGIVAVHNLDPQCVVGNSAAPDTADVLHGEPGRAARLEQLRRVSQRLLAPVQAVVRDDADAVDAILDEARVRDADLIVVGWRPHVQRGRGASSVPSRVVDFARGSVLVIPCSDKTEP
jgi:nucleotide-binding universal stress UspA family protein